MSVAKAEEGPRQHTVHTWRVAAGRDVLYDLVADVTRWPVLFGPTLHVDVLDREDHDERFRLWALVGGEAKAWTSRRTLDPENHRITFEQERTSPPIAAMAGEWIFRDGADGTTQVVLEHDFSAVGDDPAATEHLRAAVDRNSQEELRALARLAELGHVPDELVFAFDDDVPLEVAPNIAYAFIHDAARWPERLPHVDRVELREPCTGVQDMEMDTVTGDGSSHTTRSIRLCFPPSLVLYKQLVPPALLLGHAGAWRFTPGAGTGTVVTARHQVAVDPTRIGTVLGAGRTLADARDYVRGALGANSRATLTHAATAPS